MANIQIGVLGPLEAKSRGVPIPLGGPQQRAVLAMLLCARRDPVSIDQLADRLWGERLPPSARVSMRAYLSRLRRAIECDRPPGDVTSVLVRVPTGYALRLADDQVDAWSLETRLAAAGRGAATDPVRARDTVTTVLGLWRGVAYVEFTHEHWALAECARLNEPQFGQNFLKIGLDLRLGARAEARASAERLTHEHPLREEAWRLLSLALWADDRQADALATLRQCRRTLAEEIGLDPGRAIVDLERAILTGDRAPLTAFGDVPRRGPAIVPRQLPSPVPDFVGRGEQLKRLNELADLVREPAPRGVVVVLSGTAGVGKTSLAVHWAHHAADRFPDGQLYADLRGFDAGASPRRPGSVIREFLSALRVPRQEIPADPASQAGLYRSVLSGRRLLIVLDNARSAEQVRALLPGAPGCLVIVASRHRLTGLIAGEAAQQVAVDVLTGPEARDLLAGRIGAERVDAEPEAVAELIEHCGRLPIALAVIGARISMRDNLSLAAVAAECRQARSGSQLSTFETGDPRTDLRSVFSWSYHALHPAAALLFRQLGRHSGIDFSLAAAASLGGLHPVSARRRLTELADAHLVVEHRPGRYRQHDLLAAYAAERGDPTDPEAEQLAATERLLDHYLQTAHAAAVSLHPHRLPITLARARPGVVVSEITDAVSWFVDEQSTLVTLVDRAHRAGLDVHAWQLAWAMTDFLDRHGRWEDLIAVHETALRATSRSDEPRPQALTHRALARASVQLGRIPDALQHYRQAIRLFGLADDRSGQGHAHLGLGWALAHQARSGEAIAEDREALRIFEVLGDRLGQARSLNHLGAHETELGEYEQALSDCRSALSIFDEIGDQMGQAATLDSLGLACHRLGQYDEAADHFTRAAHILRQIRDRFHEAQVLDRLGDARHSAGAIKPARAAWQAALRLLERLDHPTADKVRAKLG